MKLGLFAVLIGGLQAGIAGIWLDAAIFAARTGQDTVPSYVACHHVHVFLACAICVLGGVYLGRK